MGEYTRVNPVTDLSTDANGTTVSTVRELGHKQHLGRIPAFAGLAKYTGGLYVENEGGITVDEALRKANLDFKVKLIDNNITVMDEDGVSTVPFPGRGVLATYPDGTRVGMGNVGNTYKPIQNTEMAQIGQDIIDEGGANVVAAGAFGSPHGSRTYMAFKLPKSLLIGGDDVNRGDRHDVYFTLLNSHNGKSGLVGLIAPIRFDCTNQTTATFGKMANRFTVRHSGDTDVKVIDARTALKMTFEWTEAWKVEAEELLKISCTGADLQDFINKALPTPNDIKTDRAAENWDNKRLEVKTIITESDTNDFGRGTAYAAFNGFTEWVDHFMPTKTKEDDLDGDRFARYGRLVGGGETDKLKLRAATLLGVGTR